MSGGVEHVEDMRTVYKILVGKPKNNGPLARYRCRWKLKLKLPLCLT